MEYGFKNLFVSSWDQVISSSWPMLPNVHIFHFYSCHSSRCNFPGSGTRCSGLSTCRSTDLEPKHCQGDRFSLNLIYLSFLICYETLQLSNVHPIFVEGAPPHHHHHYVPSLQWWNAPAALSGPFIQWGQFILQSRLIRLSLTQYEQCLQNTPRELSVILLWEKENNA